MSNHYSVQKRSRQFVYMNRQLLVDSTQRYKVSLYRNSIKKAFKYLNLTVNFLLSLTWMNKAQEGSGCASPDLCLQSSDQSHNDQ